MSKFAIKSLDVTSGSPVTGDALMLDVPSSIYGMQAIINPPPPIGETVEPLLEATIDGITWSVIAGINLTPTVPNGLVGSNQRIALMGIRAVLSPLAPSFTFAAGQELTVWISFVPKD